MQLAGQPWQFFPFPNSGTRTDTEIEQAFTAEGLEVAAIQREMHMWTWVLCTDASLWLHDKSHGGGGRFTQQ